MQKNNPITALLSILVMIVGLGNGGRAYATIVDVAYTPWNWEVVIQPLPATGLPQVPITLNLSGTGIVRLDAPFNLGTVNNPLAVPTGGPFSVQTEIIALSLTGTDPDLGQINVGLQASNPSTGAINNLQNNNGFLVADSFFDVFVDIELPNLGMMLINGANDPISIGMSLTIADLIPDDDTLWIPNWNWTQFTINTPELQDQFGLPWDTVIQVHTHIPEPSSIMLLISGFLSFQLASRKMRGNKTS